MMKYTEEHVWLRLLDDGKAEIGITPHAQEALGDVVFVDLPRVGAAFAKGAVLAVVESVKAAADVYMPASGEVLAVNDAVRDDPSLLNSAPLTGGWLVQVRLDQPDEVAALMDEASYQSFSA